MLVEDYRGDLIRSRGPEDLQKRWTDRFATGVRGPPPRKNQRRG